jgi:hypothetical protein
MLAVSWVRHGAVLCTAAIMFVAGCSTRSASDTNEPAEQRVQVATDDGTAVSYVPLSTEQNATVRVASDGTGAPALPADYNPAGKVYQFSPMGMAYAGIEVRVVFDASQVAANQRPVLLIAQPGERWIELADARVEGQTLVGNVPQLAYAVAATHTQSSNKSTLGLSQAQASSSAYSLKMTVDAATSPALPVPNSAGYIIVTQATQLVLSIGYTLPSNCSGTPKLRAYGVFVPASSATVTVKTIELANRSLSSLSGLITVSQTLGASENGVWTFATAAYCTNTGTALPKYALLATGPVLSVKVTATATPVITQAPRNVSATEGTTATFSVATTGDGIAYQWQLSTDGGVTYADVAGATSATLSITTALSDNGSLWRARVTNAGGSTLSTPATLAVSAAVVAPTIVSDPANQSVMEGTTASFTVVGAGTPAPAIQWQTRAVASANPDIGWTVITGATNATYTTPITVLAQSGSQYRVVLTNGGGMATSLPATLTVQTQQVAPSIVTQPTGKAVQAGLVGTFVVEATGTAPLSYQWFKNGQPIVGATGSDVAVLADPADVGSSYSVTVQVTNPVGSVTGTAAVMTIDGNGTPITASTGGTIDGPNGMVLTIPAGALTSDANVSITTVAVDPASVPAGFEVIGDLITIGPVDLSLSQPMELQLPMPEDIPAGYTLAVIPVGATNAAIQSARSERVSAQAAIAMSRATGSINVRRAAIQGQATVLPSVSASAVAIPASGLSCLNPQNSVDDKISFKTLKATALSFAKVPLTACALVDKPVTNPAYPSTADTACIDKDQFVVPISNAPFDDKRALLSRHVDCRQAITDPVDLRADLRQNKQNGQYSYAGTTVDDNTYFYETSSVGAAQFITQLSVHGKANSLSKSIDFTIEAANVVFNSTYLGTDKRPSIKVRPILTCENLLDSTSSNCGTLNELTVPLTGSGSSQKVTMNFTWTAPAPPAKDVATFRVKVSRLDYAIGSQPIDRSPAIQSRFGYSVPTSYFEPYLGDGMIIRCDRGVAKSNSGCIFPDAAAVLVYSTGGNEKEAADHVVEAWGRGAPGKFRMKAGYRAVVDDSVTGSALTRTQVTPLVANANRFASCDAAASLIALMPRMSSSCPNGKGGPEKCQCDEYPFASTYEGAFFLPSTTSAKFVRGSDNGSGGAKLVASYNSMRIIDLSYDLNNGLGSNVDPLSGFVRVSGGDSFWVAVEEAP